MLCRYLGGTFGHKKFQSAPRYVFIRNFWPLILGHLHFDLYLEMQWYSDVLLLLTLW